MTEKQFNTADALIDTIVNTLLQVGDRVAEISSDLVIHRLWDRKDAQLRTPIDDYAGRKIREIRNDQIFSKCAASIEACFATRRKQVVNYTIFTPSGTAAIYSISMVPAHPDPDFIFAVIEMLPEPDVVSVVEDKWKTALNAAGDGVWDWNVETHEISFSDKWHEVFGYTAGEVATQELWLEKIHPDDVVLATQGSEAYLKQETDNYVAQFRYRQKGGGYKWILSRGAIVSRRADGRPLRVIGTHMDIDELKITEEKYYSTAKFLSNLIGNISSGVLVTDQDGCIIFANQAFCNIFDKDVRPEALVGTNYRDGIDYRKRVFRQEKHFVDKTNEYFDKKKAVFNEEWELKDGRLFSRDFVPITFDNNKTGGIWMLTDVTTLKNNEKRFEEQRNFYEQILNCMKADIVVYDGQERYLFINPTAVKDEELRKAMIGQTDEYYCRVRNRPAAQLEQRREIFRTARREKKPIEWLERLVNRQGAIEYQLRNFFPVFDDEGNLKLGIGYGINITDREVAREDLKVSRDTFASAFNYSAIGMALVGPDGVWIDVNNALCELIGYSREELMKISLATIIYPDDNEVEAQLMNRLLRGEISTYTVERRFVAKRKKIIQASLTVSIVRNADNSPKFFIAQVVDITMKKELENEVGRRHAELEATKVSLMNKITQLEQLSHIIAHNLRGPASNIKMLAEALVEQYKAPDGSLPENNILEAFSPEQIMELIQESSTSLLESLATLIEITEIKLNKEIPFNECDVNKMIKDITTQMQGIIFEKGAVIRLNIAVQKILYPKVYLENILYNLLSNSLKYCRKDVVPEIVISTRKSGDRVQIVVKDNGLGIDLKRFGSKIFKLNQVFHEGYESKGIGLYITKTQVESLGGGIEVQSQVNEGCEFTVTL